MTKQKTIKERARELLKKLEVHYKVKDKVHYRDLVGDKNLTLITKALQDTIKDTKKEVIGEIEKKLPKAKKATVIQRVTRNLGAGNYSSLEDGADIRIKNPKLSDEEFEQARGWNEYRRKLLDSLLTKNK